MGCDQCDAMHQRLVIAQENENAVLESLKDLRRKYGHLQGEMSKLIDSESKPGAVEEVFAEWQLRCGYPTLSLVEARRKLITARLREPGGKEKLVKAIYGYSRFPFVPAGGGDRIAEERPGARRFDKLETIFRDGIMVDKGCDLAVRADYEDGSSMPGETPWPVGLFEAREVVAVPPDGVDRVPIWVVPAPCHGDGKTLRAGAIMVRWGARGQVRARCFKGCGGVLAGFERLRSGTVAPAQISLEEAA